MKTGKKTVVVGMSGGVDSSVSALLLKQQGYDVIGLFMKNWEEKDASGTCMSSKEYEDVVKVCEHLAIPYYSVNFVDEYRNNVFSHFIEELKQGYTPNPDVLCNREIKFLVFLQKAMSLGADYLATGHYCRIKRSKEGQPLLLKGLDPEKDQSYFLNALKGEALEKVLFPIGHLTKKEVRKIAQENGLATAEKKDSTGICFIGERNFKQFLSQYIPYRQGPFETLEGKVIGHHEGIAYYTLGQRKGIGIGGAGDAWFVAGKNTERNAVIIAQGADHPALFADELNATEISWITTPPSVPFACKAKIRYRQPDQDCVIEWIKGDRLQVRFLRPQRAITPRQSVVFYDGDICLGGAMIAHAGPSYHEMKRNLNELPSLEQKELFCSI